VALCSLLSVDDGVSFESAVTVADNGNGVAISPMITTNGAGKWTAVFIEDGGVRKATSTTGNSWTEQSDPFSTRFTGSITPFIAKDGDDSWVVAWASETEVKFVRSSNVGINWSPWTILHPPHPSADPFTAQSPRLATDGNGHWVAVWHNYDSVPELYDVYTARSSDGGATWSEPVNLTAPIESNLDSYPDVATDGAGNWIIVWESRVHRGKGDDDIKFVHSTDNGATWTAPEFLNAGQATDGTESHDQRPRIAAGPNGTFVVSWNFYDRTAAPYGTDLDVLFTRGSFTAPTGSPESGVVVK